MFIYYYHVFLCCETNKKKVLQKEIKDLTHEAFDRFTYFFKKILSCKGQNNYDVQKEKGWEGLEIGHVLTDSTVFKQQIYCLFLWKVGGWVAGG